MRRTLVIGATGLIGRQVAAQLAETGAQVRALTRNPDAAGLPLEIEVVGGDLTRPETIDRCLDGTGAVFLVWTAPAEAVAPALQRITKHARRIVFLSSPYKTPHPFFQQPNPMRELHAQIESLIQASGLEWTFLRPGMFAANAARWWAPRIRAGAPIRWPHLSAPTAPIHERDIAAVAIRALSGEGHSGAEYVLTGPESLTQFEQLDFIGRAIGRVLRVEEMSPEDARREWIARAPAPVVDMLLDAWAAALGQPAFVSSTFAQIMGTKPRSFFEWAQEHAGEFRA
jgi:uncharacterized protein YbjT (DUF2867 family)